MAPKHSNVWQGPMARRGSPFQEQSSAHLFSSSQLICSRCHARGHTLLCVTGNPQGLTGTSATGVTVPAQAKPDGECVGCECRGDRQCPCKPNPGVGWQSAVERRGDRYDHRHHSERLVTHGKSSVFLEVTWRWSVFKDTELWAN